jgi:GAF domain-containing protein
MIIPLIVSHEVIGAFNFGAKEQSYFTERDQELGLQLASLMGNAIENFNLIQQTQKALADTEQQSQRLAALNEISEKLGQAETLDAIYQTGASVLSKVIIADRTSMAIVAKDGQHAELLAVSGEDTVVSTGSLIPLEGSTIGEAIRTKRPTIVTNDPLDQPDPGTEGLASADLLSFLVVPVLVGNMAVGSINFGSKNPHSFSEDDRDIAVQLASLMGSAIENHNLIQQTQATLAELEATQRRYQIQAWSSYNQSRPASGFQKTPLGIEPLGRRATPETEKVLNEQNPILSEDGEELKLTIPIMLRDQPIGAIGLRAEDGKRRWTSEEIALAQEISEQFALAAESLRLLDETQRRAARERLVAEITTKIRASNDPQTILQTAAQELQNALKTKRTQVLLQGNSQNNDDQDHAKRGEK